MMADTKPIWFQRFAWEASNGAYERISWHAFYGTHERISWHGLNGSWWWPRSVGEELACAVLSAYRKAPTQNERFR